MTLWKIKNYKRKIRLSILVKTIEKRVIKEVIQTEAWPNLKIEDRKTKSKAKKNKAEVDQKK
jgi:hypothetical protein